MYKKSRAIAFQRCGGWQPLVSICNLGIYNPNNLKRKKMDCIFCRYICKIMDIKMLAAIKHVALTRLLQKYLLTL